MVCAKYGILLFMFFVHSVTAQDACTTKTGQSGRCVNIRNCPEAIEEIRKRINPKICSFDGADPIVCCAPRGPTNSPGPQATTASPKPAKPTYNPPMYTYDGNDDGRCEPLSANITAPKTGRKAWDKCVEYQEKYVYPCVKGVALLSEKTRVSRCGHGADELIIGGVDTTRVEFPHMALLGFGDTAETADWKCGGTLISERFILTAGHCTSTQDLGPVTFIRLGAHKRTDPLEADRIYRVRRIIKHPEFKSPKKYNDIALLESDTEFKLDQFAVPACIHIGDPVNENKAIATGWGATKYKGSTANTMQKVTITKFTAAECLEKFPVGMRHMEQGFSDKTQICYGDKNMSKDTCQGDSGGPLQIKNQRIYCMYTVIGVTSFGRACGFIGEPGIYTRVAPFASWIESVVWA